LFKPSRYLPRPCPTPPALTPAKPEDLSEALAFALLYSGRKQIHDGSEMMADMVAKRLVEHLERSGFVIMKRLPSRAAPGRGYES
jgi:hypothetical protein